jgi:hypothetical protein
MSIEIITALIAASVALATTVVTGFIAWKKFVKESGRWLFDLRSSVEVEQYKLRVEQYDKLVKYLINLTSKSPRFNPDEAHQTASEINKWLYSSGGLCADKNTYAAVVGLRNACTKWKEGGTPNDIWMWRDLAINCMRKDLYQRNLAEFNFEETSSYIEKLKNELR